MKKVSLLLFVLVGLLVVASACGQAKPAEAPAPTPTPAPAPAPTLTPSPQKAVSFQVEVSRKGFNNTAGEFRLEVEEGQEVEITFVYGDGDFPQDNPHIIAIPALGITTRILDKGNPEDTVRFTAGETGEVNFMCIEISCVGHPSLMGGIIVIEEEGHGHEEGK